MIDLSSDIKTKIDKENNLYNSLFNSSIWCQAEYIGVTYSMDFEFNTLPILEKAYLQNKKIFLPVCYPNKIMKFHKFDDKTALKKSKFGVLEPESHIIINKDYLDLIIVPGIVFKNNGYRIGFGGGFYDRYLVDFKGQTCSLVFSEQLNNNWQPDNYDIPIKKLFIS